MSESRRLPVGMTVAVAISLLILCALGTWQLQRLAWKRDLLQRIAAVESAPAQPLAPVLDRQAQGASVEFTRVTVQCPGLAAAPFVEIYALREGQAGVRLVSACKAPSRAYGAILVDRGFVADIISARPPVDSASQAPLTVKGVLRSPDKRGAFAPADDPAGKRWYTRDVPAMARALGVSSAAPVMLMAETATNPEWKALVPAPLPANITNRHLEYAFTWFGLAGALIGVYAAVLWRRWKS
jgi:surfeit locus 1 family protein